MLPIGFYITMFVISILGLIGSAISVCRDRGALGLGVGLLCMFFTIYWGVTVGTYKDRVKKAVKVLSVKTDAVPQVDTIVTNRTDTIYIYNFSNPLGTDWDQREK